MHSFQCLDMSTCQSTYSWRVLVIRDAAVRTVLRTPGPWSLVPGRVTGPLTNNSLSLVSQVTRVSMGGGMAGG